MVKYLIETGLMGVYDFVICKHVRKVQDLNLSVTFTTNFLQRSNA